MLTEPQKAILGALEKVLEITQEARADTVTLCDELVANAEEDLANKKREFGAK